MTSESQSPLSFLPSLRKHSSLPPTFLVSPLITYLFMLLSYPNTCQNYLFHTVKVTSLYRHLGYTRGSGGKQHYWVRREGFLLKDRRLGFEAPSLGFNNCGPCVMTWVQSPGPTWWRERSDSHKLSPSLHVCTVHVYPPTQQMNKKVST